MNTQHAASINLAGMKLKNPVMPASGTFGYGEEYAELFDINKLGAIVTKSITLYPERGNPPPRLYEVSSGLLNSIGLQNDGLYNFIKYKYAFLSKLKIPVIVSIAGQTLDEYVKLVLELNKLNKISAYEVNVSCPNVKSGMLIGKDIQLLSGLVCKLKRISRYPLIIKLTPNDVDITAFAKACEKEGADAVSLINTFKGMSIDINSRLPRFEKTFAGLSGPAIKPIALRMVYETARTVKIPVIGVGGISTAADALEFLIAGASAVQVGTANFANPFAMLEIIEGIKGRESFAHLKVRPT